MVDEVLSVLGMQPHIARWLWKEEVGGGAGWSLGLVPETSCSTESGTTFGGVVFDFVY